MARRKFERSTSYCLQGPAHCVDHNQRKGRPCRRPNLHDLHVGHVPRFYYCSGDRTPCRSSTSSKNHLTDTCDAALLLQSSFMTLTQRDELTGDKYKTDSRFAVTFVAFSINSLTILHPVWAMNISVARYTRNSIRGVNHALFAHHDQGQRSR